MSWLSDFVESCSTLDEDTREAYWARGVSDEQIESLKLGYSNGELPEDIDFPDGFRKWSHSGAKLKNSFVLPLTNPLGEILGFQFRSVVREERGYLDYFFSRAEPVLLGLGQSIPNIWESKTVCLVEGGFDYFPVQRVWPYTVPTLTAKVDELLLRWLHRMVRKVVLFYDSDKAGQAASNDFLKSYGSKFEVKLLEYPRGVKLATGKAVKDPAELWEALGDDRLSSYLTQQMKDD